MATNGVIAVAIIGVVGTLGAAVIGNWDKLFPKPPAPQIASAPNLGPTRPSPNAKAGRPPTTPGESERTFSGQMGPLEPGISFNQGDLYDRPSSNAQQCSTLCYNDNRCIAMTYIASQQRCWLKGSIGPVGQSSDMTSSRRIVQ